MDVERVVRRLAGRWEYLAGASRVRAAQPITTSGYCPEAAPTVVFEFLLTHRESVPSDLNLLKTFEVEGFRSLAMVHATSPSRALAVEQLHKQPGTGLVFSGHLYTSDRSAFRDVEGPVVYDCANWKKSVATSTRLFGVPRSSEAASLRTFVERRSFLSRYAAEAPADADIILTPTSFVPADRLALVCSVIEASSGCDDPRVVPLIPTHVDALGDSRIESFCNVLKSARAPVALLFASDKDHTPFSRSEHVVGLRKLLGRTPGILLLACGPVIALDALVNGAGGVAIGISAMWRHPVPPGTRFDRKEQTGIPAMLQRLLWEHQQPSTFAEWYRHVDDPLCLQCPEDRSLSSFKGIPEDRHFILRHNMHSWMEVLEGIAFQRFEDARDVLANERREALYWHRQLRPQAPLSEFDVVLRHLVALDDGELPAWLTDRPWR